MSKNDNNCPRCNKPLECLSGESAHPSNWYCPDEACGYKAWAPAPYERNRFGLKQKLQQTITQLNDILKEL
jgi:hypothetical protein